jgi:hypothetical protein
MMWMQLSDIIRYAIVVIARTSVQQWREYSVTIRLCHCIITYLTASFIGTKEKVQVQVKSFEAY